jgi:hypothetical protein
MLSPRGVRKEFAMLGFIWSFVLAVIVALLTGCVQTPVGSASVGPDTPGWTGRTVVVGSSSTISGAAEATYLSQKWGFGRQR